MADDINTSVPEGQQALLQKEAFEIGMSDEDLLSQIEAWERESGSYYSRLREVWIENMAYYHGNQTGVGIIRGRQSRAVENRIFMAVETMIPIATSRLPDIEIRSGEEDEQSQMNADELQDILGYHMERISIQAKAEQFLRDMIVKRYGVFKIDWNPVEDDVDLRVIDPRRIRVPKFGRTTRDLAFILEDLEMSYNQIVDRFGKDKAEKVRAENPKVGLTIHGHTDTTDFEHGGHLHQGHRRKATFSIVEVWTNDFVAWKAGSIILDKKSNPFFDIDSNKNFFEVSNKPYVIKSLFETDESMIGDTDYVQQLMSVQDNINTRKRQIENIIAKVANPPLLIDSDVMSEEQAASITNEEGLILYGKQAADGTKIRYEQPGQVPNYMFLDLEGSRTTFDNIWGIHSTTRGEREGRETLGGRQLLRAADLGRIDLVARQLERALDEIAQWWTQLIKMFYTSKKSFSIAGEDGTRFIKDFTAKKVGKVKLRVIAGSTLPKDEVSQRQEAIELWQQKALGIRTLYKRLKLPNRPDAIDDFIETQSGKILREGGGTSATQVAPATPPVQSQI